MDSRMRRTLIALGAIAALGGGLLWAALRMLDTGPRPARGPAPAAPGTR